MSEPDPIEFRVSVRELVDFAYRSGNLGGDGTFSAPDRAVEGTRGHRRLQQARGESYQPEVTVDRIFTRDGATLRLSGRVDGIVANATPPLVEEIKTIDGPWSHEAHPPHLAQVRIYAALLAAQHDWPKVDVRLTYLDLQTELETDFRSTEFREDLTSYLETTLAIWFEWLIPQSLWIRTRNEAAERLEFPFAGFRDGQRALARSVYRAVREKKRLFIEAPHRPRQNPGDAFPRHESSASFEGRAHLLPHRQNSGAAIRRGRPRPPAWSRRPDSFPHAYGQTKDLFHRRGATSLRHADLPVCAGLLRPDQTRSAGTPAAGTHRPCPRGGSCPETHRLSVRVVAGRLDVG